MSNKKFRKPGGTVSRDEAERIMKSTMAREHALIAIDHLFRARQLAHQAQTRVQLVGASGGKTQNQLILQVAEEMWKGMVTVFMQTGVIKPGDIGRYGIPAADRVNPADKPPGSNGAAQASPGIHGVDLSNPEGSHGEDNEETSEGEDNEETSEGDEAAGEADEEASNPELDQAEAAEARDRAADDRAREEAGEEAGDEDEG